MYNGMGYQTKVLQTQADPICSRCSFIFTSLLQAHGGGHVYLG